MQLATYPEGGIFACPALVNAPTQEPPPISLSDLLAIYRQPRRANRNLPLNRHHLSQAVQYTVGELREIGYVFAPDVSQRARRIGWDSGISFGGVDLTDAIVTHNHPANRRYPPSDPRYDGGGFSRWDLQTAISGNMAELRAVTERHTYVVRRPVGGWSVSADAVSGIYRDEFRRVQRAFASRVAAGEMSPEAAVSDAEVTHAILERVAEVAGFAYRRDPR